MAILNVYYNAGSNTTWTNPSRVWNTLTDLYADRAILPSDGETSYILSQTIGTADPGGSYAITKVEVGLSYRVMDAFDNMMAVRPIFGGSTNGAIKYFPAQFSQTTAYADITSDAAGPGASNWTWSNISGLDLKTWGLYTGMMQASVYVYEVWLRMTYTLLGFSKKINGVTTYSKVNGIAKTSLTKINSIT